MLDSKLLFFFGALGSFNAFILSLYFAFLKKNRSASDYVLSILLLLLAIRVGVSCIYFFGDVNRYLIQTGQIANLLLGPTLLYLFKTQSRNRLNQNDYLHLSVLALGLIVLWFIYDFKIWDYSLRFSFHALLSLYLIFIAIKWRKPLMLTLRGKDQKTYKKDVIIAYVSTVFVCLGFAISLAFSYILGPLLFSFILYISIGISIRLERTKNNSYQQKKIDIDQYERLSQQLEALMEKEELYRDSNLKLDSLASELSISKHLLSQLLNDNLAKSFSQFINEYRVEAACKLIADNKPYSMEAIGYEVGFHSRSSFFSAFKKIMGETPAVFKKRIRAK